MRHFASRILVLALALLLLPVCVQAKPKKKPYNNSAEQVFAAALRTARERHVVTYVNEKMLMFTFETGRSFASEGFVANAAVEADGENKSTLIINVQNKKGLSWGAGDRMADKFYEQVSDEMAGDSKQVSAVKTPEGAIAVPTPNAVPNEPSMTKSPGGSSPPADSDKGKVILTSVPEGADIDVDGAFVGNTPSTLKLPAGKHTVKVSQAGFKAWSKEISVLADSETNLKATFEKE